MDTDHWPVTDAAERETNFFVKVRLGLPFDVR